MAALDKLLVPYAGLGKQALLKNLRGTGHMYKTYSNIYQHAWNNFETFGRRVEFAQQMLKGLAAAS